MNAHSEKISASNSRAVLAELAQRASTLHRNRLKAGLRARKWLLEARRVASHGEWSGFLREAGIPQRTARRMLTYARCGIESGHMAVLAFTEIDAVIAKARAENREGVSLLRRIREAAGGPDDAIPAELCGSVWEYRAGWLYEPEELAAQEWEYAGAVVGACIKVAREHGDDPGELAMFIADFPKRPLPESTQ